MKCWPTASGVVTDKFARRLDVAAGDPALEFEDRLGHRGRQRDHFFARGRRFVSCAGALEKARADRGLHRRQPPKDGRMIDAEKFGRPDQRTGVRDRLDQPKFVPAQTRVHDSNDWSPPRHPHAAMREESASSSPYSEAARIDAARLAPSFETLRGAAARRSRSLIAAPSPWAGIGATAIRVAPAASKRAQIGK